MNKCDDFNRFNSEHYGNEEIQNVSEKSIIFVIEKMDRLTIMNHPEKLPLKLYVGDITVSSNCLIWFQLLAYIRGRIRSEDLQIT